MIDRRTRGALRRAWLVAVLLCCASCTSALVREANRLAELPQLPYRIAVVGGSFLPDAVRDEVGRAPSESEAPTLLWSRTFESGVEEPIAFREVLRVLRRGRAATRVIDLPELDADRRALARGDATALERARQLGEAAAVDLIVLVEGIEEGPVQYLGVTGQWPITTVAWLLAGLGMFVPDHRYESKARMRASILDVHSGRPLLPRLILVPDALELSLIGRSDVLGIVSSILIPPTLVGSDVENVVEAVREEGSQRMILNLLARLKDDETLETVRAEQPLRLVLAVEGAEVAVELRCRQELQDILVQAFDSTGQERALDDDEFARFREALLASVRREDREVVYRARYRLRGGDAELRLLVQDVAGQRASSTVRQGR